MRQCVNMFHVTSSLIHVVVVSLSCDTPPPNPQPQTLCPFVFIYLMIHLSAYEGKKRKN